MDLAALRAAAVRRPRPARPHGRAAARPRGLGGVRAHHLQGLDREERLEEGLREGVGPAARRQVRRRLRPGRDGLALEQDPPALPVAPGRVAEGVPRLPRSGSFARLHRRDGAPPARRRRRRSTSARPSSRSRPRTTARPASCSPTAHASTPTPSSPRCRRCSSRRWRRRSATTTPRKLDAREVAGRRLHGADA